MKAKKHVSVKICDSQPKTEIHPDYRKAEKAGLSIARYNALKHRNCGG